LSKKMLNYSTSGKLLEEILSCLILTD